MGSVVVYVGEMTHDSDRGKKYSLLASACKAGEHAAPASDVGDIVDAVVIGVDGVANMDSARADTLPTASISQVVDDTR